MRLAARPAVSARNVFELCCNGIEDGNRKGRLLPNVGKVEAAAIDYSRAGDAGAIHTLRAATYEPLKPAMAEDFTWLYEKRLVGSASGRVLYERLRDGNRNGRCALCNMDRALTLDHHLPKADHPVFAVTPDNLLPACRDCNGIKLANQTPTLNTYFDELGSGTWLTAVVIPVSPCRLEYSLQIQPSWSGELMVRAQEHFRLFKLNERYTYQAARQVVGIRGQLATIFATRGTAGVRQHLRQLAESWQAADQNSWEAALYAGLFASGWFCDGGFSK